MAMLARSLVSQDATRYFAASLLSCDKTREKAHHCRRKNCRKTRKTAANAANSGDFL